MKRDMTGSKVYVVRLSHPRPLIEWANKGATVHYFVTKTKLRGRSAAGIRVRRRQWCAIEQQSAFAAEFSSIADAKRVLKASAIKGALEFEEWMATILCDVTPGRRHLFQSRQLIEVWPKPNAIDLLAAVAG